MTRRCSRIPPSGCPGFPRETDWVPDPIDAGLLAPRRPKRPRQIAMPSCRSGRRPVRLRVEETVCWERRSSGTYKPWPGLIWG